MQVEQEAGEETKAVVRAERQVWTEAAAVTSAKAKTEAWVKAAVGAKLHMKTVAVTRAKE